MTLNTIDAKYVLDAIDRLKIGKASGPDKVTTNLIECSVTFTA